MDRPAGGEQTGGYTIRQTVKQSGRLVGNQTDRHPIKGYIQTDEGQAGRWADRQTYGGYIQAEVTHGKEKDRLAD